MYENESIILETLDSIIKPENINVKATNAVNTCITNHMPLDCKFFEGSPAFDVFCEKIKDLFNSNDVKRGSISLATEPINTSHNHISIEISRWYTPTSFLIHIFEKVTLVYFLVQNGYTKFLAALNTSALKISADKTLCEKSAVVQEKTRLPIREYDSYSPVKDAKIISSRWERTNLDGQRSFAGGLKPENNPIIFTLEYGILSFCFNETNYNIKFSRSQETFETASLFNSLSLPEPEELDYDAKNSIYNFAIDSVKASLPKRIKTITPDFDLVKLLKIATMIPLGLLFGMLVLMSCFSVIKWILAILSLLF